MTYKILVPIVVVVALAAGAMGAFLGVALTEDEDPPGNGIVVGRVVEARAPDDGLWLDLGPNVSVVEQSTGLYTSDFSFLGQLLFARFRITALGDAGAPAYTVSVSRDCYDVTALGDPWPSPLEECR